MAAHPPPVPPDQRPDKGPGEAAPGVTGGSAPKPQSDNPREQGQSGNISQNTTNKGLQHDR